MTNGHPVGWDYDAVVVLDREVNGRDCMGTGMHDQVICWDDEIVVELDTKMRGVTVVFSSA